MNKLSDSSLHIDQLNQALEEKDYRSIERLCISTLKDSPLYADAWLALGKAFYYQGYGQYARRALRRACLLSPTSLWVKDTEELIPSISDGPSRPYLEKIFDIPDATVTAALIVKDEIRCIARCLNSVIDAVDEIVIVDTGSSDGTIECIQDFQTSYPKIKLVHFVWCNDFAAARNATFPYITSDWVLWIDADEYLELKDAPSVKEAAGLFSLFPEPVVLTLGSVNHMATTIDETFAIGRMFSLKFPFQFCGVIHEEPVLDPSCGKKIHYSPTLIRLHHDGYHTGKVPRKEKLLRNIILLEEMIRQHPSDPKWLYYYGRELLSYDDIDKAKDVLEKAEHKAIETTHGRTLSIQKELYKIYTKNDLEYEKAEALCHRMLSVAPGFPDAYYYLARVQALRAIAFMQKSRENVLLAEKKFEQYNQLNQSDKSIYSWKNHLLYADIMKMSGNLADAHTIYQELLPICPEENKQEIYKSLAFINAQKQRME